MSSGTKRNRNDKESDDVANPRKKHKRNTNINDNNADSDDETVSSGDSQLNWTPSLPFPVPADERTLGIIEKHNGEYIIATDKKLYKFSLVTSQHTEWVDYGSDLDMEPMALSIAFNEDTQTLCICDKQNLFTIANGAMSAPIALPFTPQNMFVDTDDASLLFAGKSQIHVLFGQDNNKHFVWDIDERKWHTIKHFEHFSDRWYSGLVHLKSQKRLLLMGGVIDCNQHWSDKKILSYSLESNTWTELGLDLLCSVRCFGAAVTRNDDFVLLFGGYSDEQECDDPDLAEHDIETDTIHVLNVKLLQCNLSKIKCPEPGSCFVFIEDVRDPRTVYGYVRDTWKSQKMTDIPYPPTYLIDVVQSFYSKECLHWVSANYSRKHCKIYVDDIVTNLI